MIARTIQGNALFLILIAVALFAALSYAITQSSKGGGTANKEIISLQLAQMDQYAATVRNAIQRLDIMSNSCTIGTGRKDNGTFTGTINTYSTQFGTPTVHANPNAPPDNSCDIFHANGGGVTWQAPPPLARAAGGTEYLIHSRFGLSGVANNPLYIGIYSIVSKEMCMQYNTTQGITNPPGDAPEVAQCAYPTPVTIDNHALRKGWDQDTIVGNGTATGVALRGHMSGCFKCTEGANDYYYYNMLSTR